MDNAYCQIKKSVHFPRLPLEGNIDLTYRCNNNCRHCWLRISFDDKANEEEFSFEEVRKIADEARSMGCRRWSISGGEPMLRPDFSDIFDYLTFNFGTYSLNTNGTLITPKIARLMKRKGTKMIALYGACADIHDHITRNPGSFEALTRGVRYLKEAGAGFTVQIVPMKDNYHQFNDMVRLAGSLSKHYRIGAPWLYLSASGDKEKNAEIKSQRLPPQAVIELDKPDLSSDEWMAEETVCGKGASGVLFYSCINIRRDFHVDPYGKMTFCSFVKDSRMRYDLRAGSFKECWNDFIPSLAVKIRPTGEHKKNCGSCELRQDCRWCPVYAYLEHRDFNAKVDYLCAVAKESRKDKDEWRKNHRRYYRIAGITIRVESDLAFNDETFHSKFKQFEVDGPRDDTVSIRHHFSLPELEGRDLGQEVYRNLPWAIYKTGDFWIYLGISPEFYRKDPYQVAVFNKEHTRAEIYNDDVRKKFFLDGGLHSLALFPSDQILIARVLADRQGVYLHSCGVNYAGKGLLFVGHSEAGKSTMAKMLKDKAEILCDDRIIIRKHQLGAKGKPQTNNRKPPTEFRIHGTWNPGDVPDVSAGSAPLRAVMFLEKSKENRLIPIKDNKEKVSRLLSCVIRPFVTVDWWENTLVLIGQIVAEVPAFVLRFDKSGAAAELLRKL